MKNTIFLNVFTYCGIMQVFCLAVFSYAVAYVTSPKLLVLTQYNKEGKYYPYLTHLKQAVRCQGQILQALII